MNKLLDEIQKNADFVRGEKGSISMAYDDAIEIVRKHMDGKVLVPVEPTEAMIKSGLDGRIYCKNRSVVAETVETYKAMLKAAEGE